MTIGVRVENRNREILRCGEETERRDCGEIHIIADI